MLKGGHDYNSNADPNPDLMQGDMAKRTETNPAVRSHEADDATASAKTSKAKGKYTSILGFTDDLEYVECNMVNYNISPEQALQEQREIERFLAEKAKTGSTFDCICWDQLKVPFELHVQYHYR